MNELVTMQRQQETNRNISNDIRSFLTFIDNLCRKNDMHAGVSETIHVI